MRGLSLANLGTPALSWLDLRIFVAFVQREHTSALAVEIHGPAWSVESQLLAEAVDALNQANWQRAGRKSAPRPKRIPRPWEKPKATTIGAGAVSIPEFHSWWDKRTARSKARKARVQRHRITSKAKPPTE